MRICIVCSPCIPCRVDLEYGGLEKVVALIARELAKEHEVTLIAGKGSKVKGCELITPIESRYALPGEPRELELWAKAGVDPEDFDVIDFHTHQRPAIRGDRLVWSIHDLMPPHPLFPYKLVARSRFHATWLERTWGYDVTYVYNCLDPEEFRVIEDKDDYLLFLSRITKGKGCFNLVELAKRVQTSFVIAGEDRIEYGIDCYELARFLSMLPSNCEYLGYVSPKEKRELLSKARALVLPYDPSYQEVFGIVILEALASGTPVFAIKNGAIPELLGEGLGPYGYVADSLEELAKAIEKYLKGKFSFDPWVLRDYAERFSPAESAARYLEIYSAIARSRKDA